MNKKIELLIIDAHRSFIDTKNKGTLIEDAFISIPYLVKGGLSSLNETGS